MDVNNGNLPIIQGRNPINNMRAVISHDYMIKKLDLSSNMQNRDQVISPSNFFLQKQNYFEGNQTFRRHKLSHPINFTYNESTFDLPGIPQTQRQIQYSPKQLQNLSIQDIVNSTVNKPVFGMSFYKSPSNEMLLKKVKLGVSDKEKIQSFLEIHQKKKYWVPSPDKYKLDTDWNNILPKNTGKFLKKKRYTQADEIELKSRIKEKSVPGPNHYIDFQWKKSSLKQKPLGNYKFQDLRVTFTDDFSAKLFQNPSPNKYESVQLDKIKERTLSTKISTTHFPRFKPNQKKDYSPACTSYNITDAIQNSQFASTRYSFSKDKRIGYFEQIAKKNKIPGAGSYQNLESAYNSIHRSPVSISKKRQ